MQQHRMGTSQLYRKIHRVSGGQPTEHELAVHPCSWEDQQYTLHSAREQPARRGNRVCIAWGTGG